MNYNKYGLESNVRVIFFTKEVDLPATPGHSERTPASKYFLFTTECIPMEKDGFVYFGGGGGQWAQGPWQDSGVSTSLISELPCFPGRKSRS